jgi:beta-glucosidase/6-phospho-beta-glucosidase/beta-galactosidase
LRVAAYDYAGDDFVGVQAYTRTFIGPDGITVLGYQHWSALDNYEWASGFAPTFGLIGWDKETFARTPKASAKWYGGVARANGV